MLQFSSTSSDDSSCDEARLRRFRRGIRMGTLREGFLSDPSSSEFSCDTVIYVGPNGQPLSDRELTDNEGTLREIFMIYGLVWFNDTWSQ